VLLVFIDTSVSHVQCGKKLRFGKPVFKCKGEPYMNIFIAFYGKSFVSWYLYCVGWDVKPYSLTHSVDTNASIVWNFFGIDDSCKHYALTDCLTYRLVSYDLMIHIHVVW